MAKHHRTSVEEMYSMRTRPRSGYVMDDGASAPVRRSPPMESHEVQKNQAPEDRHGPGYDNDTSGWVHGAGEDATRKTGFDFGNAWRMKDKGIAHSPDDTGRQRKPEPNKP
jgi:hypothetical protein